eukprot:2291192-Amphidinium_carterae.1
MGCGSEQHVDGVSSLCRLVQPTATPGEQPAPDGPAQPAIYLSHATTDDGNICTVGYPSDVASTWHCSSRAVDLFRQRDVCDRDNLLRDAWVTLAQNTYARVHAVPRRGFYSPAANTQAKLNLGKLRITDMFSSRGEYWHAEH